MSFEKPKYQDKFQLLNKYEQLLLNRLKEATPAYHVFSQVSMSQLFHIKNFRTGGFLQIGEIGRKSIDFLLCREDTSIVLAIELNGPTHEREDQRTRDEKKRAALEEAGIPLLVLVPDAIPETDELRKIIASHVVSRRTYEIKKREAIAEAAKKRSK